MTPEELLIPRWKVIAAYPCMKYNGNYSVGDVLTDDSKKAVRRQTGEPVFPCEWSEYPYLFKKLEWWEGRTIEEMPKYVKRVKPDSSIEVLKVLPSRANYRLFGHEANAIEQRFIYPNAFGYLPATEAEYLSQQGQGALND